MIIPIQELEHFLSAEVGKCFISYIKRTLFCFKEYCFYIKSKSLRMNNRHRFSYIYSVEQLSLWIASCWDFQCCAAEDFLWAFAAVHNILIGFLFSRQLWNSLSRTELVHLWFFLSKLLWIRACVFLKQKTTMWHFARHSGKFKGTVPWLYLPTRFFPSVYLQLSWSLAYQCL